MIKPFDAGLVQPLPKRLLGVGGVHPSKPWRWRGKRLHHGGDACAMCLASQNPFERVLFVTTRTDLGVKLLNTTLLTIAAEEMPD